MTGQEQLDGSLFMAGLDGANPLAFLAALGTLRGLTLAWPERRVRLSWTLRDTWRPRLHTGGSTPSEEETLDGLERFMKLQPGHDALEIGDNLPLPAEVFRGHALSAAEAASAAPEARAEADFIAAFGCDAVQSPGWKGQIQETAFRTLGAGQTQFLKPMRDLAEKTTREHLRRCLFAPWNREDSRLSLRWDPEDDRRYAHRWRDPTASGEEPKTEWGANRLAFEALPLFPVMPLGSTAITTGFSGNRSRDTFLTWPVWDLGADLDTVRSMLALRGLQEAAPDRRQLAAMGIREVFRSQRINNGRYRNFTPSTPV